MIRSAKPVDRFEVAGHEAVLLDKVVSEGSIRYRFILVVYEVDGEPCLFVASEVNDMAESFGGGSHFLGVFPGDGHLNLGSSNEWSDREAFTRRALSVARDHLTRPPE